jgi:hypothetical protein
MPENRNRVIAVIGGEQPTPGEAEAAEEVGRELARRGATVVCGGLGGVMEAVCRGAASENGLTVGILPGSSPAAANPFVRVPIASGVGYARNIAVVRSAQAVIAIGGAYGTLSEIAHALQGGIPVVGLNTWSLFRNGQQDMSIVRAEDPVSAVEAALNLAQAGDAAH